MGSIKYVFLPEERCVKAMISVRIMNDYPMNRPHEFAYGRLVVVFSSLRRQRVSCPRVFSDHLGCT